MGQKTHPKGFRLITTQNHLSEWYGNKLIYPKLIKMATKKQQQLKLKQKIGR